jgi:pimeloyl-ACP methyl ester carboxylesterase
MLSPFLILTFLGVNQTVLPSAQAGSMIPDDRIVDVFGVRLHYLDWGGTGDTLLFLPPSCETAHIFGDIAPAFTDRFRVLGLTTRGCAQSGPADAYDLDAQLREVDEFLSALQLEHATLAGFSAGGGKVIRFARLYPSRVTKLVVLDSVYSDVPPELEQRMGAAIAKLLGDRDDDSTDWNQRYFQAWELGAWSAAMDRNMQATSPASVSPAWWAARLAHRRAPLAAELQRRADCGLQEHAYMISSAARALFALAAAYAFAGPAKPNRSVHAVRLVHHWSRPIR